MNTNTTTSKTGLLTKYLVLLAALMVAFGPQGVQASDSVPFKGSGVGAIVSASPDPAGVLLTVLVEGHASHVGHFIREELVVFDPVAGTLSGTFVTTAANGDQIFGTVTGQFISPTTVVGTNTFTGGTGRFENATGQTTFSLVTADGIHFAVEFGGRLSSVGANKK